jgi:carboxypeptidase D
LVSFSVFYIYIYISSSHARRVEQPVGTGFSQGTVTAKSEADIAADFIGFFKNWAALFGTAGFKVYVTGESYAGRYIPYISAAMLNTGDKSTYNVSGALIYDGCIGQFDVIQEDMVVTPFIQANKKYFSYLTTSQLSSLTTAHHTCGYDTYISEYLVYPPKGVQPPRGASSSSCQLFNKAYNYAYEENSCFNVYEVNQTCPIPNDPLDPNNNGQPYFDRSDVKKAMHAPTTVTWEECSNGAVFKGTGGPEQEGDTSPDPIQGVLPQVIGATNRVLVANGDLDMIIITNGTLMSIQNMTWNGALGFQTKPTTPITVAGLGQAGVQHYERGLMWAETYYSGHMQPQYQPAVSYRHLQWLLGYIQTL